MSCPNSNTPLNISQSNVFGKCDLKCNYSFSYKHSSCTIVNQGTYLSLSYDKSSSSSVIYNTSGYFVSQVRLYCPSLHSFNSIKTDAELIIVHYSNDGSKPLLICVPIVKNNSSSVSSRLFYNILKIVSTNSPSVGGTTKLYSGEYNLSNIIPKKPYFSYTGKEPYQPCNSIVDYIVYSPINASIDITPQTLTMLKQIIRPVKSIEIINDNNTPKLFYNSKGPTISQSNDIYIDCQPVGFDKKDKTIINNTQESKTIISNSTMKFIFIVALIVMLLYSVNIFTRYMKSN
jgi:carbonic anhydrase